jgi:hypothetical protein
MARRRWRIGGWWKRIRRRMQSRRRRRRRRRRVTIAKDVRRTGVRRRGRT